MENLTKLDGFHIHKNVVLAATADQLAYIRRRRRRFGRTTPRTLRGLAQKFQHRRLASTSTIKPIMTHITATMLIRYQIQITLQVRRQVESIGSIR